VEWWQDEELISLAEVANGYRPHKSGTTVWRWCFDGLKGIKLEHRAAGGRLYTSWEAVQRFEAALAALAAARTTKARRASSAPQIAAALAQQASSPPPSPAPSARAAAAGRKLAQLARL
jgi:hypothetical protein